MYFNLCRRVDIMPERDSSIEIQKYIKNKLNELNSEVIDYTWYRALIVSYLTLINGRRGQ